ncbi:MAG: heterodisulfide reductase-related iron-sulfur binding cluster [Promethearchaeota archaeon]
MKEDYKCPCKDVDPNNFITNDEVEWLINNRKKYKFQQRDYLKLYNCIHCNDCGTSEQRFILKQKFLKDGNKIEGLNHTIERLEKYGTPFQYNKSRIKYIEGISKESNILLYLGCFTTVKTPRYGESIIKYLLQNNIKFCILDEEICCGYPILCTGELKTYNHLVERNLEIFKSKNFEEIITVCPSCYMVFKKHYSNSNIKVKYFTEYLKPPKSKKSGNLIIQHACPLKNGEIPNIADNIEELYKNSGYNVLNSVPRNCCGGGVGHQLRTEISEAIAIKRMEDFKLKLTNENNNYITTYCPDAYWILKVFGRKTKINFKLTTMCDLLK